MNVIDNIIKELENACIDATDMLKIFERQQNVKCTLCKYYEGVHNVQGHAPCSKWNIGGVMWNDYCSRFERVKE